MKKQSPCYKCSNRKISCHSKCKLYLDFSNECKRINEAKFKEHEMLGAELWRHEQLCKISRKGKNKK